MFDSDDTRVADLHWRILERFERMIHESARRIIRGWSLAIDTIAYAGAGCQGDAYFDSTLDGEH